VLLVLFGACHKADDLSGLLAEHMANKIILVYPLHDDDDAALVVLAAVKGVVEPAVGTVSLVRAGGR
jgi:hypothetical protein